MGEPTAEGNCWRARPVMAAAVAVFTFAFPVVFSIIVGAALGYLWSPSGTALGMALRWIAILSTSTLVFFGCEHLTRRALPLAVLLKMGMVFPGRAPRRMSVAMRSWTTKDLSRRIDEAHHQGVSDEPIVAAEKIVALAATLNAHDRKTRGHAERVRAYTDLIAEELRLPTEDRDRLRWSALLHDVGKLTVHADILNKPDTLSEEEWDVMRKHPLEGAKLTAPLAGWLGPWSDTIAEHHERFDGGGYPYGLAGQGISMGGRIVSVADCYDTMTSVRSYNKPMSTEAARAELAACAGAQFDPVIVRAFLAVSVSRLRAVAPLAWIGSMPFGNVGAQLARVATVGRVAVMGLAAVVGVVGLTAAQHALPSPSAPRSATALASPGLPDPTQPGGSGSGSSTGQGSSNSGAGASGGAPIPRRSGTVESQGGGFEEQSDPSDSGASPSGGGQSGGGDSSSTSTTVVSGSGSSTTTSTTTALGGTSPTTTPTTPTTTPPTTTTTVPAPPVAPTGLTASPACQLLVIGPEIELSWKASPTTSVTGYLILRSTTKTGTYSAVGSVSGRTTVSYTDTSVSGVGSTYWYKVEAVAGSQSATSSPATASTGLCIGL